MGLYSRGEKTSQKKKSSRQFIEEKVPRFFGTQKEDEKPEKKGIISRGFSGIANFVSGAKDFAQRRFYGGKTWEEMPRVGEDIELEQTKQKARIFDKDLPFSIYGYKAKPKEGTVPTLDRTMANNIYRDFEQQDIERLKDMGIAIPSLPEMDKPIDEFTEEELSEYKDNIIKRHTKQELIRHEINRKYQDTAGKPVDWQTPLKPDEDMFVGFEHPGVAAPSQEVGAKARRSLLTAQINKEVQEDLNTKPEYYDRIAERMIPQEKERIRNLNSEAITERNEEAKKYIDRVVDDIVSTYEQGGFNIDEAKVQKLEKNLMDKIDTKKLAVEDIISTYLYKPKITRTSIFGPAPFEVMIERAKESFTSGLLKAQIQPETPTEQIFGVVGDVGGIVSSLHLTGAALKGGAMLTKTGQALFKQYPFLSELGKSVAAFNVHGQLRPELGWNWEERVNTALMDTEMALVFSITGSLFPDLVQGTLAQGALFGGLSWLNGESPEIIATNALVGGALHATGFIKRSDVKNTLRAQTRKNFEKLTDTKLKNNYPDWESYVKSVKDAYIKGKKNLKDITKIKSLERTYREMTERITPGMVKNLNNAFPSRNPVKILGNNIRKTVRQVGEELYSLTGAKGKPKLRAAGVDEIINPTDPGKPKLTDIKPNGDARIVIGESKTDRWFSKKIIDFLKSKKGRAKYNERLNEIKKSLNKSATLKEKQQWAGREDNLRALGRQLGYEGRRITDIVHTFDNTDRKFREGSMNAAVEELTNSGINIFKIHRPEGEIFRSKARKTISDIARIKGVSEEKIAREFLRRTRERITGQDTYKENISNADIKEFLSIKQDNRGIIDLETFTIKLPLEEIVFKAQREIGAEKDKKKRSKYLDRQINKQFPKAGKDAKKRLKSIIGKMLKGKDYETATGEVLKGVLTIPESEMFTGKIITTNRNDYYRMLRDYNKMTEKEAKDNADILADAPGLTPEQKKEYDRAEREGMRVMEEEMKRASDKVETEGFSREEIKNFSKVIRLLDTKFETNDIAGMRSDKKYGKLARDAIEAFHEVRKTGYDQDYRLTDDEVIDQIRAMPSVKERDRAFRKVKRIKTAQTDMFGRETFIKGDQSRLDLAPDKEALLKPIEKPITTEKFKKERVKEIKAEKKGQRKIPIEAKPKPKELKLEEEAKKYDSAEEWIEANQFSAERQIEKGIIGYDYLYHGTTVKGIKSIDPKESKRVAFGAQPAISTSESPLLSKSFVKGDLGFDKVAGEIAIVDTRGKKIIDTTTKEGAALWDKLGNKAKNAIQQGYDGIKVGNYEKVRIEAYFKEIDWNKVKDAHEIQLFTKAPVISNAKDFYTQATKEAKPKELEPWAIPKTTKLKIDKIDKSQLPAFNEKIKEIFAKEFPKVKDNDPLNLKYYTYPDTTSVFSQLMRAIEVRSPKARLPFDTKMSKAKELAKKIGLDTSNINEKLLKELSIGDGFISSTTNFQELIDKFGNFSVIVKDVNGQRAKMNIGDFLKLKDIPAFGDRIKQVFFNASALPVKEPQMNKDFMSALQVKDLLKKPTEKPKQLGELVDIAGVKLTNNSTITRQGAERFVKMITDNKVRETLKDNDIKEVVIEPPYKFTLSEQANINVRQGIIRINADAFDPTRTIYHELGHRKFKTLPKEIREQLVEEVKTGKYEGTEGYLKSKKYKEAVVEVLYQDKAFQDFYNQVTKEAKPVEGKEKISYTSAEKQAIRRYEKKIETQRKAISFWREQQRVKKQPELGETIITEKYEKIGDMETKIHDIRTKALARVKAKPKELEPLAYDSAEEFVKAVDKKRVPRTREVKTKLTNDYLKNAFENTERGIYFGDTYKKGKTEVKVVGSEPNYYYDSSLDKQVRRPGQFNIILDRKVTQKSGKTKHTTTTIYGVKNPQAQYLTTSQLKDFYTQATKEVKPIPKELEPLAKEAKKYDSAKEFSEVLFQKYTRPAGKRPGTADIKEPFGTYLNRFTEGRVRKGEPIKAAIFKPKKPYRIDFHDKQTGEYWKDVLSKRFGNKKGKALTNELRKRGYDSVFAGDSIKEAIEIVALDRNAVRFFEYPTGRALQDFYTQVTKEAKAGVKKPGETRLIEIKDLPKNERAKLEERGLTDITPASTYEMIVGKKAPEKLVKTTSGFKPERAKEIRQEAKKMEDVAKKKAEEMISLENLPEWDQKLAKEYGYKDRISRKDLAFISEKDANKILGDAGPEPVLSPDETRELNTRLENPSLDKDTRNNIQNNYREYLYSGFDPGIRTFVYEDVIPAAEAAAEFARDVALTIRSGLSPSTVGWEGAATASIIREKNARLYNNIQAAYRVYEGRIKMEDKLSDDFKHKFIDIMERDRKISDKEFSKEKLAEKEGINKLGKDLWESLGIIKKVDGKYTVYQKIPMTELRDVMKSKDSRVIRKHLDRAGKDLDTYDFLESIRQEYRDRLDNAFKISREVDVNIRYKQHYFPHIWRKPGKARKLMKRLKGTMGKESFVEARLIDFIEEGRKQGLKLITNNPEELILRRESSSWQAKAQKDMIEQLREHRLLRDTDQIESQVRDYLYNLGSEYKNRLGKTTWNKLSGKLKNNITESIRKDLAREEFKKELKGKFSKDGKDRKILLDKMGRKMDFVNVDTLYGEVFMPKVAGNIFQRYLEPRIWSKPTPMGKVYKSLMKLKNMATAGKLAISAFHFVETGVSSAATQGVIATRELMEGNIEKGIKGYANILVAPFRDLGFPGANFALKQLPRLKNTKWGKFLRLDKPGWEKTLKKLVGKGTKMIEALYNVPQAEWQAEARQLLLEAGGRAHMSKYWRINSKRNFMKAVRGGNYWGAAIRSFPAALEALATPMFDYWIPRTKTMAFYRSAKKWVDSHPEATSMERKMELSRIWDSTDNRFGQLVYDNLFWPTKLKDIALLGTLSLGWNLGTVREFAGAGKDLGVLTFGKGVKPILEKVNFRHKNYQKWLNSCTEKMETNPAFKAEVSDRMLYTFWYAGLFGVLGGTLHWAFADEAPKSVLDFYYPWSGERDAEGKKIRFQLPTMIKEIPRTKNYLQKYGLVKGAIRGIQHKMAPVWTSFWEIAENKDFYDTEIWSPSDPVYKQAMAGLEHLFISNFKPISVSANERMKEKGLGSKANLSYFGLINAPRYVTTSKAEVQIQQLYNFRHGEGRKTKQEREKSKKKSKLRKKFQRGKLSYAELDRAVDEGIISANGVNQFINNARIPSDIRLFKMLKAIDQNNLLLEFSKEDQGRYLPHAKRKVKDNWNYTGF